jgi:hypothetical protein
MTVLEQTAGVDKNMALNKSQLAKLLATENLTVVHNSSARTASFDTEKRILTLPVWMNMTADVYDLLTGHEVGHALYTDSKELTEGLKALHSKLYPNDDFETSRSARVLHQVVNVVEDPRIEKLTKRRYPGIKAPFNRGYKILWEQGLFGAADQNVSHLSLTDRINLHFKVGTHISVPFSAEERVFVTMIENAETMDDVFAIAEAIVLHVRENPMREKPQRSQRSVDRGSNRDQAMEDMDDMSEDNDGDEGQDGDTSDMDDMLEDNDGDEGQDGDTSDSEETEDEGDEGESAPEGEGADSDPCDEGNDGDEESDSDSESDDDADSDDDDADEDESESENDDPRSVNDAGADDPVENHSEYGELDGLRALTESSFAEGTANLADTNTFFMTVTAPVFDMPARVHDYKRVLLENKEWFAQNNGYLLPPLATEVTKFKTAERMNISYMLKEFELRRAARTHARTLQSKTGRLDTNKLHSYKISDDLFRRNTIVQRGQSHGLFFLVDFSGSMACCIEDLMKSLTSLTMFCRLSNIPFEVYTFTDAYSPYGRSGYQQTDDERNEKHDLKFNRDKKGLVSPTDAVMSHHFFLRNVLSSRMNAAEYNEACVLVRAMAKQHSGVDRMGGTPLLQALMVSSELLEKFKKNNGLDSVSFITMSDGMTDGFDGTKDQLLHVYGGGTRAGYITYTDKVSKKSVTTYSKRANYDGATLLCGLVVKSIQERHNANTVGYFIADKRNISLSLQQLGISAGEKLFNLCAKFKAEDFISMKLLGFDEYFVVSKRVFNLDGSDMQKFRSSTSDAPTARKVFSEYKKALGKNAVGRSLLKSFVARITARDAA